MKKNILRIAFSSLAVLALGFVSSCSNENEPSYGGKNENSMLVKPTEIVAYSGGHVWTGSLTRGHDVNGNLWYQNWDRPTNVTEEEIAKVLEEASKQRVGAKNDIHIDWNNYWVQQVWTGTQDYVDGTGQNIGTGASHMNELFAYTSKVREQTAWWPTEEFELRDKREYENPYEHVNNFNYGSNNTEFYDDVTGEAFKGTTLMTDMYAEGIIDQFAYNNTTDSKIHYEYIILEVDGSYYICFDFFAEHPEGQDANKNMDVERDWVFNDWIVKISPAYHVGETPEVSEPTPDPDPVPDPDTNDDDNQLENHTDEVEVNLGVDTRDGYNESHLSIHVRAVTDVEVFIPVPAIYYCDADDMAIVEKHFDDFFAYGGDKTFNEVQFDINGSIVKLTVSFEEGGIRITTDGIDENVINYCREQFDDGITFEVWNYFNDTLPFNDLKAYLNQATVRFLDKTPEWYINAFGEENYLEDKDCNVSIVSDQRGQYADQPIEGEHLNNSAHNLLFEKKQ